MITRAMELDMKFDIEITVNIFNEEDCGLLCVDNSQRGGGKYESFNLDFILKWIKENMKPSDIWPDGAA